MIVELNPLTLERTYLGSSIIEIRIKLVNDEAVLFEGIKPDVVGFDTRLVQDVQKSNNVER